MTETWIGKTLSKVQIQQLIGRGGMADVYLGVHATLNVPRAVKILHGHLSADPDLMRRFRDEAKSVAGLRHPNIVQVYDFDLLDGRPYIIMELLRGLSLAAYLKGLHQLGTSLPLETVARVLDGVASALDYAHAQGIIHRDIKPANVLLRQGATPLSPSLPLPQDANAILTDFGIARISGATTQTLTGTILGTPAYMSPEQVRGETVDVRSDTYSLGIILYEMLAGTLPFDPEVDTTASLLYKQANVTPPPLANTSPSIQQVVIRALEKDKDARYQRAGDLADGFRAAFDTGATTIARPAHPPARPSVKPRSSRRVWIACGTLGLAAVVVGAFVGSALLRALGTPAATPGDVSPETAVSAPLPTSPIATSIPSTADPAASVAGGSVFQDASLQAILPGLPELSPNETYEVWLTGPDQTLRIDSSFSAGNLTISYVDPAGGNLLASFDRLSVSLEPNPDPSPSIPGEVVFSGTADPSILAEIRRLDKLTRGAALTAGLVEGLRSQAQTHDSHLGFALTAGTNANLVGVKQHSEHTINVLAGTESADFGDYDGNEREENPGDGFGAIPYLRLTLALALSELENPDASDSDRAITETLVADLEAALVVAEDSLRLAKQITSVDSPAEAEPLLAQWDPMRLSESLGRIALQVETSGIRLWIPLLAAP